MRARPINGLTSTTRLADARLRGGGDGLPAFVEREFREFLSCGILARGFARFRCTDCQREILVAFSCQPTLPIRFESAVPGHESCYNPKKGDPIESTNTAVA